MVQKFLKTETGSYSTELWIRTSFTVCGYKHWSLVTTCIIFCYINEDILFHRWSKQPLPLARTMQSRLLKHRWLRLPSLERKRALKSYVTKILGHCYVAVLHYHTLYCIRAYEFTILPDLWKLLCNIDWLAGTSMLYANANQVLNENDQSIFWRVHILTLNEQCMLCKPLFCPFGCIFLKSEISSAWKIYSVFRLLSSYFQLQRAVNILNPFQKVQGL